MKKTLSREETENEREIDSAHGVRVSKKKEQASKMCSFETLLFLISFLVFAARRIACLFEYIISLCVGYYTLFLVSFLPKHTHSHENIFRLVIFRDTHLLGIFDYCSTLLAAGSMLEYVLSMLHSSVWHLWCICLA